MASFSPCAFSIVVAALLFTVAAPVRFVLPKVTKSMSGAALMGEVLC